MEITMQQQPIHLTLLSHYRTTSALKRRQGSEVGHRRRDHSEEEDVEAVARWKKDSPLDASEPALGQQKVVGVGRGEELVGSVSCSQRFFPYWSDIKHEIKMEITMQQQPIHLTLLSHCRTTSALRRRQGSEVGHRRRDHSEEEDVEAVARWKKDSPLDASEPALGQQKVVGEGRGEELVGSLFIVCDEGAATKISTSLSGERETSLPGGDLIGTHDHCWHRGGSVARLFIPLEASKHDHHQIYRYGHLTSLGHFLFFGSPMSAGGPLLALQP
ncbi:hypothetical protein ZIOFF_063038 [Zingiber officinale]|uniref:Uncharacterized protein n=1 Tax=Zingiber officinale TaxID=94328 RepID=A0A8J5F1Y9_ZINOF|nr:hypothetical protein ZIOFF_063038 [Zingiber officinale]